MDTSEKYVRMCRESKEIQRLWHFENGDYVFDPAYEEVQVLLYYPVKDFSEIIWLPRLDQIQAICIDFFIQNGRISRNEAFVHFLELYTICLKETFNNECNVGENDEYEEINSCEGLMLRYIIKLIYWKR